jgi:hypothetical protein
VLNGDMGTGPIDTNVGALISRFDVSKVKYVDFVKMFD